MLKVGDLVSWTNKNGVVVRVYKHKVWRTHEKGVKVNWSEALPELFADVMIDGNIKRIPQCDLQIVSASHAT